MPKNKCGAKSCIDDGDVQVKINLKKGIKNIVIIFHFKVTRHSLYLFT